MIYCHTNGSISGSERLDGESCYSKEQSYGQRISNLAFLFIKKEHTAGVIILISTYIMVLLLVLLDITFIFTIK